MCDSVVKVIESVTLAMQFDSYRVSILASVLQKSPSPQMGTSVPEF